MNEMQNLSWRGSRCNGTCTHTRTYMTPMCVEMYKEQENRGGRFKLEPEGQGSIPSKGGPAGSRCRDVAMGGEVVCVGTQDHPAWPCGVGVKSMALQVTSGGTMGTLPSVVCFLRYKTGMMTLLAEGRDDRVRSCWGSAQNSARLAVSMSLGHNVSGAWLVL